MKIFHLMGTVIWSSIILLICLSLLFVCYKGNRPMSVNEAPRGMTYFEFMSDRIDAAKSVKPTQCGWGIFLSLAFLGPIYSVVYTGVGLDPHGPLARMTAPDPDIPKKVGGASWSQVPDIW